MGWFACAAALSALLNDAIALKCGEMGAHSIIGEIECLRQFIHCAARPAQQHHYASTRTAKKTLIPVSYSHHKNLSLLRPTIQSMAQIVKKVNNFIDFLDKLWYEIYMIWSVD
jgi:hypothetical protein